MRLHARDWIRTVHVLFGLIVVVPGSFMALIVEGIAGLWPRRLLSRRLLLFSLLVLGRRAGLLPRPPSTSAPW